MNDKKKPIYPVSVSINPRMTSARFILSVRQAMQAANASKADVNEFSESATAVAYNRPLLAAVAGRFVVVEGESV